MNSKHKSTRNSFTDLASSALLNKTEIGREFFYNNDLWLKMLTIDHCVQYIHCESKVMDTIYGNIYKGVLLDAHDIDNYFTFCNNTNIKWSISKSVTPGKTEQFMDAPATKQQSCGKDQRIIKRPGKNGIVKS